MLKSDAACWAEHLLELGLAAASRNVGSACLGRLALELALSVGSVRSWLFQRVHKSSRVPETCN